MTNEERRANNLKVDARKRAVKLWRGFEMSYGKEAKQWAINLCNEKIKKAYTKDYKEFWVAVKRELELYAP